MSYLATTELMKKLDNVAINEYGIPSLTLMENAATAVFNCINNNCKNANKQVSVLCGPGNNGGDGIAVARLLLNNGYTVRTFLIGNRKKMTPDSIANEKRLIEHGGKLENYIQNDEITNFILSSDIIVDAIFGVGLQRDVSDDFLSAIELINSSDATVFACDIPSGLDGNSGKTLGNAVKADFTITFSLGKKGLYINDGKKHSGEIIISDIGIPKELIDKFNDEKA